MTKQSTIATERLVDLSDVSWREARDTAEDFVTKSIEAGAKKGEGGDAHVREAMLKQVLWLLYRTRYTLALACVGGVLDGAFLDRVEAQVDDFVKLAVLRKGFTCRGECDWKGTIDEVGPGGRCPKCKALNTLAPVQSVIIPTAAEKKLVLGEG